MVNPEFYAQVFLWHSLHLPYYFSPNQNMEIKLTIITIAVNYSHP